MEKNFLKTFNKGDSAKLPSVHQIGYLADVKVGHIEKFKFYEEFQIEYHLRKAGFLEKLKDYNKERHSSLMKKENTVDKSNTEKEGTVLKNTRKNIIDYN